MGNYWLVVDHETKEYFDLAKDFDHDSFGIDWVNGKRGKCGACLIPELTKPEDLAACFAKVITDCSPEQLSDLAECVFAFLEDHPDACLHNDATLPDYLEYDCVGERYE